MAAGLKIGRVARGFAAFLLAAVLLYAPLGATVAAVEEEFDLDVVFVIDNSGSMINSDPKRLALTASNLFIDMCEDSDSRIGYVMFTEKITAYQPLTDITNFSEELKKAISATRYPADGYTDTALGLEKGYELLKLDSLDGKSDRKPVIILLSDGNTYLEGGGRTTAQSLAALEDIKQKFAAENVPVYTIGFNYSGELDVAAMASIAEATGAMAQEAKTADELPTVLRRIYGELTGSKSVGYPAIIATGEAQSVKIPINNESVYKATITIMSDNPVADVSLSDPGGAVYDGSDTSGTLTVNSDPGGKYTLLTLYHPERGDWTLTFTGTKDDVVSIDLLSVYDLKLVFDPPVTAYNKTDLSWHLEDPDGRQVTDAPLLSEMTVTLHANADTVNGEFQPGQTSASFALPPGDYEAYLTMGSGDIVRTSNVRTFTVPAGTPVSLRDASVDTKELRLITIFKNKAEFSLDELVKYVDYNRRLNVNFVHGDWSDYEDLTYDAVDEEVLVTALKSGASEAEIVVEGSDGSRVTIFLAVNITSGLWLVAGFALLLLVAAAAVFVILTRRKPFLDSPMKSVQIQMNLPDEDIGNTPPEAALRLKHVKAKMTLKQLIDYNGGDIALLYGNAFEKLDWFADRTIFATKKINELEITIPANNRYSVVVNGGRKLASDTTQRLRRDGGIRISVVSEANMDDAYEIIFGKEDLFGDVSDGGFVSGAGKNTDFNAPAGDGFDF
ncbi:MAG: VWA domain-containing protein [Oscillospiraceae bacterium]|jgi:Mg-chelatase subunit ChlD|nr:VWA domain-containing protein [Oscillospiraceae bacterium]